jgi:N-acetylglutamate synthase-like GNAT family acetyltransferase
MKGIHTPFVVRHYEKSDEIEWLRCRVLAFLDTAYYDDVMQSKVPYAHRSIELVAETEGKIVGLLDVECEDQPGTICSPCPAHRPPGLAGMIWHLAVHPDYRGRGIASSMLSCAIEDALSLGITRFEAWTRDDGFVEDWYRKQGFERIESYSHVYLEGDREIDEAIAVRLPELRAVKVFAHYVGTAEAILRQFKRVHACSRYDLYFDNA